MQIREDFPRGRYALRIEDSEFRLRDYNAFLAQNQDSIAAFKARQQQAFEAERQRWAVAGQDVVVAEPEAPPPPAELGEGERAVASPVPGSVWKITVKAGETVALVESMKMEISVVAASSGIVRRVLGEPGQSVTAGQGLVVLAEEA